MNDDVFGIYNGSQQGSSTKGSTTSSNSNLKNLYIYIDTMHYQVLALYIQISLRRCLI